MAKDQVNDILNAKVNDADTKQFLADMGLKDKQLTNRNAIIASMTQAAINGDTRAALWLLEHSESETLEAEKTALQVIQERKRDRKKPKPKSASNRKSKPKNSQSK